MKPRNYFWNSCYSLVLLLNFFLTPRKFWGRIYVPTLLVHLLLSFFLLSSHISIFWPWLTLITLRTPALLCLSFLTSFSELLCHLTSRIGFSVSFGGMPMMYDRDEPMCATTCLAQAVLYYLRRSRWGRGTQHGSSFAD